MGSTSQLQIYSVLNLAVNNIISAETASITVDQATNSQIVKTIAKGYAGESPGAPMSEITIDSAVPLAGFEVAQVNLLLAMATLIPVQFTLYVASNELVFDGFVISNSLTGAVDTESKLNFKARGSFSTFTPLT